MQQYLKLLSSRFNLQTKHWALEARLLYWLTLVWLLVGLVTLVSASFPEGVVEYNDGFYLLKRQLLGVLIGFVCFFSVVNNPLKAVLKLSPWMVIVCLLAIFMTLIPGLGKTTYGASRWIAIGPFTLQPSELIKPFLVLQAAYLFAQWKKLDSGVKIGWLAIFSVILLGILKQPNLSTTALCGMSLWLIAVAAQLPWSQLLMTSIGGLSLATLSIYINPYQRDRIVFFLDPWQDYQGKGYQLIQSLLAIASGGLGGSGFGLSQQKLSYLPIRTTDFIFAVYAEEFGFIGSVLLLVFILGYGTLALRVAFKCNNPISRLVAIGVMILMVGQSLINIGVATGSLPTTGLPLPFFSYGTNSMIASLLLAALLIRVARENCQTEPMRLRKSLEVRRK
ncbi:cell cycle protein [Stanieria cyanosphaera PCC 7437]|uniref:Probable peptidoglycan glycosyltransferase FtsW n=1 Tax=Stanieria cyanosphaera (strain ATCC 29371 / PCC 7437) TaxID=111780 RepID=K9XT67_STAC7|nr:putative peptidoglycan glycosyltransferase FtsW [Stanieria cyanosphaera]AFZ34862.1 cell cycle protein [Stanieria cyanosphaera PCC 7437]